MFEGISPEVESLLSAAKSDLPAAKADPGLLEAMVLAVSTDATAPLSIPRKRRMLGKVLTAKAAAIAGVLVLSGGVAAAATGTLPGPVQNTASHAAEHVGVHLPNSDDDQSTKDANDDQGDDNGTETTPTSVEHPDNHGNDVSTVAHDDSNEGADHGSAVCTVASDGKCQPNATDDNSGQGNSADHRQDGEHPTTTTTPTVTDDGSDHAPNPHSDGHSDGNSGHGSDDSSE
jgi:hypothetical protein